jgi:hypothetical protein
MGFLPAGVGLIGLLSLLMLGRSLGQLLRPHREDIRQVVGENRIRILTRGLLVGPFLAAVGLLVFFLFVLRDNLFQRAAHAALVLGLWMVLTLAFFLLVLVTRLGYRPTLSTLFAAILAVPLVAYLTPIDRFVDVFSGSSLWYPMGIGICLMAVCLLYVLAARRELL